MEQLILVDQNDVQIGTMNKLEAHQKGLLHRAFSIFIFNDQNELLLQKRAASKYHSGGLWTNTCCSHQSPGESNEVAAKRRLNEEMGMVCSVSSLFEFTYKAELDNDLTEHEYDHVLIGFSNNKPCCNPKEVEAYNYMSIKTILEDVKTSPGNYTYWFKHCLERYLDHFEGALRSR